MWVSYNADDEFNFPTFSNIFKNLRIQIWIQHEKVIQMSTNMPSSGPIVLEITFLYSEKSLQILPFLTIQCFHKNINPNFHCHIWIQQEKCIQTRTNKSSSGPTGLEITFLYFEKSNFTFSYNPMFSQILWIQIFIVIVGFSTRQTNPVLVQFFL